MKKACVFAIFSLLMRVSVQAQVFVDGVNINDQDITYCQIIGNNRSGIMGTRIWIDFGQPKFAANYYNQQQISGQDRRRINFNSVIDALNFVTRNGWELVSSHVTSTEGSSDTFVYLLRKRPIDR